MWLKYKKCDQSIEVKKSDLGIKIWKMWYRCK